MTPQADRVLLLASPARRGAPVLAALRQAGAAVMEVATVASALSVLDTLAPTLVLADAELSGGGGPRFLEACRRRLGNRAPLLVALVRRRAEGDPAALLPASVGGATLAWDASLDEVGVWLARARAGRRAEARAHRRVLVAVPARVRNRNADGFGLCSDASAGGLFVRCSSPPPIGERVEISLCIEPDGPPTSLAAEVRHARGGVRSGFGARFVDLSAEAVTALARLASSDGAGAAAGTH